MTKKRPAKTHPRITPAVVALVHALHHTAELPEVALPIGEGSLITLLAHRWLSRRWQSGNDRPVGEERHARWMYSLTEVPYTHLSPSEWLDTPATGEGAIALRELLLQRSGQLSGRRGSRARV